jgi:exosortase A-associated hydrolase 1
MKHNEMAFREAPVVFTCCGEEVSGIIHQAENPIGLGVLLVVGGPQYRVGSHRQFVLLARFLAENGVTVFRFDYRGMGDSTGLIQDFEQANADIKAAVGFFLSEVKNVQRLILWGLCDAASASCFYAAKEERARAGFVKPMG